MSRMTIIGALLGVLFISPVQASPVQIFINELHYDNAGGDVGEAVELAGTAGSSLDGWQLVFYNGANGAPYNSIALTGLFDDKSNGFGFLSFTLAGIQNGAPDGLALVMPDQQVSEFISYEGVIDAVVGPATGWTSLDIGVSESAASAITNSLYLDGTGLQRSDFSWVSGEATFAALNNNQEFVASSSQVAAVPLPGALGLIILPLLLLGWLSQDKTCLRKRPV